jgi:hypothetical protein
VLPPDPPPPEFDAGGALVLLAAGGIATMYVRARLSALGLTSEPASTPNPSMLRIATAVARGAGSQPGRCVA